MNDLPIGISGPSELGGPVGSAGPIGMSGRVLTEQELREIKRQKLIKDRN
jgi:hypothetical protein